MSNPIGRWFGTLSLRRVSAQEKINFSRHLAIVIRAGLPVVEGLRIIERQVASKAMRRIIEQLIADVNSGRLLADSLRTHRNVFGDFFISVIEVGEASGTLGDNLLYLSEELKKSEGFRGKVRSAMIYPAILTVMTIAVSAFLTFFIFPKLVEAFASMNVALPLSTQILIAILGFLRSYLNLILITLVVLIVGARLSMRREGVRYLIHRVALFLPVLSSLIININAASLTRILGVLLKSGTKIVEAVMITARAMDNLVYRHALINIGEAVLKGETLAQGLAVKPHLFPPILTGMIEIGESTGNLAENLTYLSNYYAEEVDTSLRNFTAFIEPLILVVMGLIVGFVAISIITPIYSLSQSISR